jgi:hypothetical protein
MNKQPREPQLDEKVKIKDSDIVFKIECIVFENITISECRRGRGEKQSLVVTSQDLIYLEPEKIKTKNKKYKEPSPIKLTREQRTRILRNLVNEDKIRENFKFEIIILARLIRKFPHAEFLLEGFKPVIKANSILYWVDRPEVEVLYKNWAIDLTKKTETITLENEKVIEDIIVEKRKPQNLLDILN